MPWKSSTQDTDASPVADTIVFLLSDLSRGITGEMVHVDGGYHAMGSAPAVGIGPAEHASG